MEYLIQRITPSLISDLRIFPVSGEPGGRDDIFEDRDQAAPEYHLSELEHMVGSLQSLFSISYSSTLLPLRLEMLILIIVTDVDRRFLWHKREAFAAALIKAAHSSIGINSTAKEMILKQDSAALSP